jgi:predicted dehydrogenase
MAPIRMAQYGTKHGHASGKFKAMQDNPEVELLGVFEPDAETRRELEEAGGPFQGAHFFADQRELLEDDSIVAIASEGGNVESLDQTEEIVEAGKHVWYDKPAGDDWEQWQRVVARAQEKDVLIQMGYMFRYHDGFQHMARWVKSGMLGEVFSVRAHMSTSTGPEAVQFIGRNHRGGIFYDLSGHMLDQVVWLLGRPTKVTSFLRSDSGLEPGAMDNNLGVFEYENGMAFVDIAALETPPAARRFEIYGRRGSAIMEPLEPATQIRLCLQEAQEGYEAGEQFVPIRVQTRQQLYEEELVAFLATIRGEQAPDRSVDHELAVQETVLRGTGVLAG